MLLSRASFAFCPLVLACTASPAVIDPPAEEVVDGGTTEPDAGSEFDAGSLSDVQVVDTTAPWACPKIEPQLGTSCQGSLRCGYGDEVDPKCRYNVSCKKNVWANTNSIDGCEWIKCPVAKPSSSDRCTDSPATGGGCWWADGTYCACGYGRNWKCYAPQLAAGCPKTPPNTGSGCTAEALNCSYCGFYENECSSGAWRGVNGGRSCPIPD